MGTIVKKSAFLLVPAALVVAGTWWVSGGQKRSFSNESPAVTASETPSDTTSESGAASTSETALPEPDAAGSSVTASTPAVADAEGTATEGGQGAKGEKTVGKREATSAGISITDRLVSFGFERRASRDIDTVIVHSSYDALGNDPYSVSGVIDEYRQAGVSPHYLIDRKGTIYRLVEDRDVAYHAGVSEMPDGRTGVNGFSIGIEVLEKDTDSPTSAQYASLRSLIASLKSKYPIRYVLGHSDIAPSRKTDPWGFDWKEMR